MNHAPARDSEVKRKMMSIDRRFSESALGFGKFSKFLQFAASEGVVSVDRARDGSFRVRLAEPARPAASPEFDVKALGLPTTASSIKRYLAHRYKGVGIKTAERLVDQFATDVFHVLHNEPERIRKALPRSRADSVLTSWAADYERKRNALAKAAPTPDGPASRRNRDARNRPSARTTRDRGPARDDRARAVPAGATVPRDSTGPGSASPADSDESPAETGKPARSGLFGLFRQSRRSR